MVFLFTLDPLFQALFTNYGSSFLSVKTAFLVLLGLQLSYRPEYDYPDNYLNRLYPLYRPYPTSIFGFLIRAPDNACQRTLLKSPIIFDFVIVGAGAAGAVIANRLSQNPNTTVCLIEAGGDPSTTSVVPLFFPFGIDNDNVWKYKAEIVNTSSNAFPAGCSCPFGKQLGGSTGTNAMLYVCGTDRDYDTYAANGNPGWAYSSILPLIKRNEDNQDLNIVGNGTYHGTGGYLSVSTNPNLDSFIPTFEAAFNELGYKTLKDYNSRTYNGIPRLQATIKGGERESSYRAFLAPIKSRPNLVFLMNSQVTKVVFSGSKATGVNVKTSNSSCPDIYVQATKEVIISSGGYGSPQILLKSGIGKLEDLQPFGITQVKSLSVGENYQNHVYSINFIKVNPNAGNQTLIDIVYQSQLYFRLPRSGQFAELGLTNAFINTTDANATYPDIQYNFYHFLKSQEYFAEVLQAFGYNSTYVDFLVELNYSFELIMTYTILLNPKSRGTVKLQSSDPLANPKITTGYLTHPDDVSTMLRGLNRLQAFIGTDAMRNKSAEMVNFSIEECDDIAYPSDPYWKCYFKYFSANLWHPTGTCKMGPSSDPAAVVDARLKVYGFTNLRVADASIFPDIPTGNTQCPTYAAAQNAADFILSDWP